MRECIEEGILQSYVDDELSPAMAASVAEHLSACASCAEAATLAADETAMFSTAFDAERSLEVPTLRLRERLDEAIAELNRPAQLTSRRPGLNIGGRLAAFAGLFKISPQRALGFASLIALVAFAAIFAVLRLNQTGQSDGSPSAVVADNNQVRPAATPNIAPTPAPTPADTENGTVPVNGGPGGKNTQPRNSKPKKQVKPSLVPAPEELPKDELAVKPLPGEENYMKAIDSLATEIAAGGETALKPSLRAEYERNLAIVDQAIVQTRRAARRNPQDADAAEFLFSSYESKLQLLNAVAEQVRPTIATR